MGSGSSIYAINFSQYGLLVNGILGPVCLLVFVLLKIIVSVRYRLIHKRWFKQEGSAWLTPDGKFVYRNLITLLVNGLSNLLYTVVLSVAWRLARSGGMN
jgi:hypothetical protein